MKELTLIDTDILVDVGRGVDEAIAYLENIETTSSLAISVVTQMELIVGCQDKKELKTIDKFFERFDIISLNEKISNIAVELLRQYRLSHGLLIADAIIAATAISVDLPFISKNQRDYRFIKNLKIITYL
jgi:predicted nucleic acid-binding protein